MSTGPTTPFGGVAACAMGLLSLVFFSLLLLGTSPASYPGEPTWAHIAADYVLALVGLLGLAAVPALSAPVQPLRPDVVRWTSTIGLVGFAVLAVTSFWQAEYETSLQMEAFAIPEFEQGDPVSFDAPVAVDLAARLPRGWMEVGGVGMWILSTCWLAAGRGLFTPGLVRLGLVVGLLAVLTPASAALRIDALTTGAQMLYGLLLGPVWFTWMGTHLITAARPRPAQAAPRPTRVRRARFHLGLRPPSATPVR